MGRTDSRFSNDRAKARGARSDDRSSYGKSKSRTRDRDRRRGRDHVEHGDWKKGKHKGHNGKNDHHGEHGEHGTQGEHVKHGDHDGQHGHHDKGSKGHGHHNSGKHKTVNNHYYGYGGYAYPWWRSHSYFSPFYSIGYNSLHDGLYFSIGLGSYWNNWCGVGSYYGASYPYTHYGRSSYYVDSYSNNTIVVIDDDSPDVVYVPVEPRRATLDLTVGWEHLAKGRNEDALRFFSNRVRKRGDSSAAKVGYALAAAQMNDRSRAVWSMRRAFRIDDGSLGYLPLDTRLRRLVELLESRYAYDADESTGRERRSALFMVAAMRYILHESEAALDAAYAARDEGDHDSSLTALIRNAEADLDY